MKIWECLVCGFQYHEALGLPDEGIPPGTRWEDIPEDWQCPDCGVGKADFIMVEVAAASEPVHADKTAAIQSTAVPMPAAASSPAAAAVLSADGDRPFELWECLVCGFIYDEAKGWPDDGIAPGTRWAEVSEDWTCPDCGVGKSDFAMAGISRVAAAVQEQVRPEAVTEPVIDWRRKPVVIIGTGLAGYHLAREFRKNDQTTPLLMITADDGRYYSKPMVSTGFAKGKQPDQLATASAADMADELRAEIRIFTRVTAIDPQAHVIAAGEDQINYGKLVLAGGAKCIEAPLAGNGLSRVYAINNLLDYTRFRTALAGGSGPGKKILIIGAGLIGSEYANDLIQAGFRVEAVEPMPTVLGTLLPPQASAAVQKTLEEAGVIYHFGTVLERVDKAADGTAVKAVLASGEVIEADAVLSAIGVRPDLQLAQAAGLVVNRGIVTDRTLQTSASDIYALGDCAEVDGHLLYFVAPLVECAKVLGKVLAGIEAQVQYGAMPVVVKTTLCPVVVSPPPKDAPGEWQVAQNGRAVTARFVAADGRLLGFALTGEATREKEALSAQVVPIME